MEIRIRRWWQAARCIHVQKSKISTSSQYLQLRRRPKSKSQPKNDTMKAVTKPQQIPSHSIQQKQQNPSFWQEVFAIASRGRQGWAVKLAFYGIAVYISGITIIYYFFLERVPITGRRRFSNQLEFLMRGLEEVDRQSVEELRGDEEKGSMEIDGPALEKIRSIINRLVKAGGLDAMPWEVRVTNEPGV